MKIAFRNEGEIKTCSIEGILPVCVPSISTLMTKGSSINRRETIKEEDLKHRKAERTYKAKQ